MKYFQDRRWSVGALRKTSAVVLTAALATSMTPVAAVAAYADSASSGSVAAQAVYGNTIAGTWEGDGYTVSEDGGSVKLVNGSFSFKAPEPGIIEFHYARSQDYTYDYDNSIFVNGGIKVQGNQWTDAEGSFKTYLSKGGADVKVSRQEKTQGDGYWTVSDGVFTGDSGVQYKVDFAAKTVERTDIAGASIAAVADQSYTGSAVEPALTVTLGGKILALGTDYLVTYKDNVDVGTATATIVGIGDYEGTAKVQFKIVAETKKGEDITGTWTGKGWAVSDDGSSVRLTSGSKFSFSLPYAGTLEYTVSVAEGNFSQKFYEPNDSFGTYTGSSALVGSHSLKLKAGDYAFQSGNGYGYDLTLSDAKVTEADGTVHDISFSYTEPEKTYGADVEGTWDGSSHEATEDGYGVKLVDGTFAFKAPEDGGFEFHYVRSDGYTSGTDSDLYLNSSNVNRWSDAEGDMSISDRKAGEEITIKRAAGTNDDYWTLSNALFAGKSGTYYKVSFKDAAVAPVPSSITGSWTGRGYTVSDGGRSATFTDESQFTFTPPVSGKIKFNLTFNEKDNASYSASFAFGGNSTSIRWGSSSSKEYSVTEGKETFFQTKSNNYSVTVSNASVTAEDGTNYLLIFGEDGAFTADEADARSADAVIKLLDALPSTYSVSASSKEKIEAARAAYDALTDTQKALVPANRLQALIDDETKLAEILAADKEAIDAVVAKIDVIGTVTKDSGKAIEEARSAYDGLTSSRKSSFPEDKLKALTDAETAYTEIVQADPSLSKLADTEGTWTGEGYTVSDDGLSITLTGDAEFKFTSPVTGQLTYTLAIVKPATGWSSWFSDTNGSSTIKNLTDGDKTSKVKSGSDCKLGTSGSGDYEIVISNVKIVSSYGAESIVRFGEDKVAAANKAAADGAVAAIDAIGDVTKDSKDAIEAARKAYDALTDDQKKLVSADKLKALTDAEAAYKALTDPKPDPGTGGSTGGSTGGGAAPAPTPKPDQTAADGAVAAIDAIGDVTKDSKDAIEAARKAYDALTDDQKKLVSADKLKALTDAEAKLAELSKPAVDPEPTPDPAPEPAKTTRVVKKATYSVKGKTVTVTKVAKSAKTVTILDTVKINGKVYKVTAIASRAYKGLTRLKTVTIGKNVKSIGSRAFAGCENLETLVINSTVLTKAGVKDSLKGSSIKMVKAPASKLKGYTKLFSKSNCGKSVKLVRK